MNIWVVSSLRPATTSNAAITSCAYLVVHICTLSCGHISRSGLLSVYMCLVLADTVKHSPKVAINLSK